MNDPARSSLSAEQVKHVAALARLDLNNAQVEKFRTQLSSILAHVETLCELDVSDVTPMFHATDHTGAAASDEPQESMGVASVLGLAPHTEGAYLAVPKVLTDEGGG